MQCSTCKGVGATMQPVWDPHLNKTVMRMRPCRACGGRGKQ